MRISAQSNGSGLIAPQIQTDTSASAQQYSYRSSVFSPAEKLLGRTRFEKLIRTRLLLQAATERSSLRSQRLAIARCASEEYGPPFVATTGSEQFSDLIACAYVQVSRRSVREDQWLAV